MAEQDTTARESESNDGNEANQQQASNSGGGDEKKVEYWLPVGAILLLAGLILLVAQLATDGVDYLLNRDTPDGFSWWSVPMILGMLMTIGGLTLSGLRMPVFLKARSTPPDDCAASVKGYTNALLGIGFALVLLSLLNFVALAGLAHTGELQAVLGVAEERPDYDTVRAAFHEELQRLEQDEPSSSDTSAVLRRDKRITELGRMRGLLDKLSSARFKLARERRALQKIPADGDRVAVNQRIILFESELRNAQDAVDEFAKSSNHRVLGMIRLVLLPGFAILGGLFFVAGSLRAKRERCEEKDAKDKRERARKPAGPAAGAPAEGAPAAGANADDTSDDEECKPYDRTRLWAGLWYRLGEAILFALVIFLVIHSTEEEVPGNVEALLLLVGLLMGMFVKPAELLVNGLAVRVFAAVKGLVK